MSFCMLLNNTCPRCRGGFAILWFYGCRAILLDVECNLTFAPKVKEISIRTSRILDNLLTHGFIIFSLYIMVYIRSQSLVGLLSANDYRST